MITLTRRYRFSASHRLRSTQLSLAENQRLYGKCNNPFGHGHNYVLEVTAAGIPDENTGLLLARETLDRLVHEKVLRLFAHRNINLDIPEFAQVVPTTENMVLFIADVLQQNWAAYLEDATAQLYRVHLQETDRNGFELLLPLTQSRAEARTRKLEPESVSING